MSINTSMQPQYVQDLLTWGNLTPTLPINGPFSWTGNSGQSATIKYSFDYAQAFTSFYTPSALTLTQENAAEAAMELWSNVANVQFELDDTSPELVFYQSELGSDSGIFLPHTINNTTDLDNGDIIIDDDETGFSPNGSGYQTFIHEIGHSLGLSHPQGGNGSSVSYNLDLTTMSTNFGIYTSSGLYPATPMLYDIAAIQFLYGANQSYNSGGNTYFIDGDDVGVVTIWDGGGNDTLEISSSTTYNSLLDIRNGAGSHSGTSHAWIAYGANIEAATGGSGNDSIYGNDLANTLSGGDGADTIYGGDNGDNINGGAGSDSIIGGDANDTVNGGDNADYIEGNAGLDYLYGGDGNDIINSFDGTGSETIGNYLSGEGGNDTLIGSNGNDTLLGGEGNDHIPATPGNDSVSGGDGSDYIGVGSGELYITTGSGNDTLGMGNGVDADTSITDFSSGQDIVVLTGSPVFYPTEFKDAVVRIGSDTLVSVINGGNATYFKLIGKNPGSVTTEDFWLNNALAPYNMVKAFDISGSTSGNDSINGNSSANNLHGQAGNDTLNGGDANDTLYGSHGNDVVYGGNDADEVFGGGGTDALYADAGSDISYGEEGNDTLYGWTGADTLDGGADADLISGEDDADSILGGDGNDTLYGGNGNDTISGGTGADAIYVDANNDSVTGGDGADSIYGWTGADTLDGGAGADIVSGEDDNDSLSGGDDNDSLYGGNGTDTLIGGLGADYFEGGAGIDIFKYINTNQSSWSVTDYLGDFTQGTDLIDVTGLGFTSISASTAAGSVLSYSYSGGNTIVNDAGSFAILIAGNIAFTNSDFVF